MKSLAECYARHMSPHPDGPGWGDRGTVHSYIEVYEQLLKPYQQTTGNVLEIGLMGGESLRMWEEYFFQATVYGMDSSDAPLGMADLRPMLAEKKHHIVIGDASDPVVVARAFGSTKFKVVIEDANHVLETQLAMYETFKPYMGADSIYIIEDVANVDRDWMVLSEIDLFRKVTILDLRHKKGRFDDVLVVIENGGRTF